MSGVGQPIMHMHDGLTPVVGVIKLYSALARPAAELPVSVSSCYTGGLAGGGCLG